jgi:hypothetical protein
VREFKTAGRRATSAFGDEAEPITFTIDGEEFTAYPPSTGAMAMMLAAQAESRDVTENVAGLIDFYDGILDEAGRERFRERLMDRDDPFDFEMVNEIVEGLMEEWSGRPTRSPSASSTSQRSGGSKSTAKRRPTARTSSPSR